MPAKTKRRNVPRRYSSRKKPPTRRRCASSVQNRRTARSSSHFKCASPDPQRRVNAALRQWVKKNAKLQVLLFNATRHQHDDTASVAGTFLEFSEPADIRTAAACSSQRRWVLMPMRTIGTNMSRATMEGGVEADAQPLDASSLTDRPKIQRNANFRSEYVLLGQGCRFCCGKADFARRSIFFRNIAAA